MDSEGMSTYEKVRRYLLYCMLMFVLVIFCATSVLGTVWKALLMSIVARRVLCAGFGELRPLCLYCTRVVRSVIMECLCVFCKDQPLKDFENVVKR